MRKWICLFLTLSITVFFALNLHAQTTSTLIDFSKLKANGDGKDPTKSLAENDPKMLDYKDYDEVNRKEHMPTIMNYGSVAGSSISDEDKKNMVISLSAYNWEVQLNSSAAFIENRALSYCKEWHTKYVSALQDETKPATGTTTTTQPTQAPAGYTVMGVRVHFPETPYNCWAYIKPPFEIPAYENRMTNYQGAPLTADDLKKPENYGSKYNGYGIIKNVGYIKSISLRVFGNQYNNSISIIIKDDNNEINEYHFPTYLNFDGWKTLTWTNPNYIERVSNRDLYIVPLYPRNTPFIKLMGFRVYRQGDQLGGDFITYIKDVKVTYDLAVLEQEQVIEHEEAWQILKDRTIDAQKRELNRIGDNQVLQFLEKKKQLGKSTSQ
jgi:Flagellar filament outer layer protein Flaa